MTGVPVYPDILTVANWNKQKGIIAKVVKGETGIGARLTRLRSVYDAVEWQYFDPSYSGPLRKPKTKAELDERLKQARSKGGQLEALRKECFAVRDECKKLGDKWEKSLVVPKSTREHVQKKMVKACEDLALAAKSIDMDGYERVQAEIDRIEKTGRQMLKGWMDRVEDRIPKVKVQPTVKNYKEIMHQQVRGVGTAISGIPEYRQLYERDWEQKVGDGFMSGVTDGPKVIEKIDEIEKALERLKKAVK